MKVGGRCLEMLLSLMDMIVGFMSQQQTIRSKLYLLAAVKKSFYAYGITTSRSNIILTWMQSITNESRKPLLPLLTPVFEGQKLL